MNPIRNISKLYLTDLDNTRRYTATISIIDTIAETFGRVGFFVDL
jgi:hypothetical protein